MHAHFARLVKAGARAERARDVRRREPARFDVRRVAQSAQLPARGRFLPARFETGDVRELDGRGERRIVVAGVVAQRDRRLIRNCLDEIAAPDVGLGNFHFARGGRHQALDDVSRFRASRAAIGVDRRRVGEYRGHFAVNRRRRVLAGEQRRVKNGRDARREGRQIRAHVRGRDHAHRQELAVLVERELGGGHVIAPVRVRHERFRALGGPLDRAIDLLHRPGEHGLFRIQENLRAEAAADVGRDHAHLVLGQPEHERRHQQPLDVRILARHVQRVAVVRARIAGQRRTRLDRVGNEAVVHELEPGHVMRLLERTVDRRLVTQRPHVARVVRRDVVHDRGARLARIGRVDDRRQQFVIDFDQLGGILGLIERLGDDHGDLVADVAHLALREQRVLGLLHRLGVDVGDEPAARQAPRRCRGDRLRCRPRPRRARLSLCRYRCG